MKTINSRQNPHIKALSALKRAKDRRNQGKFIAEGLRVCSAMLQAGWQPIGLYITKSMLKQASAVAGAMADRQNRTDHIITLVSDSVMEKLSQSTCPSGMVGIFKLPKKPKTEKLSSGIVLAEISDPGNMGTLIRTCAAMGFTSVVVVGGVDPWSHKVVQATAGAISEVNIFSWSWEKLLKNKGNKKLVALVVKNGAAPEKIDSKNSLLVVGNEAHGLPGNFIKDCDQKITLPMSGRVESLNAAIAGAIALYLIKN